MNKERVLGFDLLRGICAIGVACYHFLYWKSPEGGQLFNIGLYGVYVFFILSGASIYVAYAEKILSGYDLRKFIAMRFFRLTPLFVFVVLISNYINYKNIARYNLEFFGKFILNATFLFGVGNPGQLSLATGGWSLGIEFCFYLIFPVILAFVSGRLLVGLGFLLTMVIAQIIFVRCQITGPGSLSNWIGYTQFLSFAGYFVVGCFIGRAVCDIDRRGLPSTWKILCWVVFVAGLVVLFTWNPDFAEAPLLGWRGIITPLLCAILVLAAGFIPFPSRGKMVPLAFGNLSYGVYLLHPIIFNTLGGKLGDLFGDTPLLFLLAFILISVVASLLMERYFERPALNFGKRMLAGKAARGASATASARQF